MSYYTLEYMREGMANHSLAPTSLRYAPCHQITYYSSVELLVVCAQVFDC